MFKPTAIHAYRLIRAAAAGSSATTGNRPPAREADDGLADERDEDGGVDEPYPSAIVRAHASSARADPSDREARGGPLHRVTSGPP